MRGGAWGIRAGDGESQVPGCLRIRSGRAQAPSKSLGVNEKTEEVSNKYKVEFNTLHGCPNCLEMDGKKLQSDKSGCLKSEERWNDKKGEPGFANAGWDSV